MSEEINCYVCGHSINEHNEEGCWCVTSIKDGEYKVYGCPCTLTPQDIAAYAVAQAYEQGRIDYGGGDVDRFLIFVEACKTDAAHKAVAQP